MLSLNLNGQLYKAGASDPLAPKYKPLQLYTKIRIRKNVISLLNGASHLVVMDTGKSEIPNAFFDSDFTNKFSQAFVSLWSQSRSEPSW